MNAITLLLVTLLAAKATPTATPKPLAPAPSAAVSPVVEATPIEPDLAFPENDDFRKKQPMPGPTPSFKPPPVTTFKVGDGITVYLVESHDLPRVSINLVMDGGSIADVAGREGTASLCMDLMSEGTEKLDRLAFEEAIADLASSVSSGAGLDEQSVSMSSLRKNLDATLDLWADALLHPRMAEDELGRDVKSRLDSLRALKGNAGGIAGRLSTGLVFGLEHPYGRFDTEKSVAAITIDACRAHLRDRVKPRGARLFVVGDITRAEIEKKVGARLASWKGAAKPLAKIGAGKAPQGRVFFVDVPSAPQAVVRITEAGPARKSPDFFSTRLLGSVLGGDFSSRINMNIREKHGYAYGASSGFGYFRNAGTFGASASVKREVTAESIHEMIGEIRRIHDEDIGTSELEREKRGAILSLPAAFATSSDVLGTYARLVYFGLPLDYYAKYVPSVEAVTIKSIRDAAKAHIKPEDLKILVVGDAATVLPKIQELLKSGELGPGDLVRLDVDGKPIP